MMIRRSESVVIHQTNGMSHQQQQSNQMLLVDDKCVRGRLYDYCNLFTNKSICS